MFINKSRDSRHFKKTLSLKNSGHSPLSQNLSVLLALPAPLLIFKHYIIHFNVALSGCWIRMWKSAGCKLKKYIQCLLIAAVTDLAVPMVNLNTSAGSCIIYQFTSCKVWWMEISFNRSQNCLVEGCGSWKLESEFLFFFFLFFLKQPCIISRIRHMTALPSWFQRGFDFPLTFSQCELPKKVSEVPRENPFNTRCL